MTRDQALKLVHTYIKNPNLFNHMLAVEAAMRYYARLNDEDEEKWGITGLLHDFDWEIHPTLDEHPQAGEPILRENGVPEDVIRAVLSHADHLNLERITPMEKTLYACDELTGLITAVALVRPSKSLFDLTSSSVKKKWKDKAFAAGANRDEIARGAEELGIDLWVHVDQVILAMRAYAKDLGLEGSLTAAE